MGRPYLSFQDCYFAEILRPDKMPYMARLRQAILKQAIKGGLV